MVKHSNQKAEWAEFKNMIQLYAVYKKYTLDSKT